MVTIEEYHLVSTESKTNPIYPINQNISLEIGYQFKIEVFAENVMFCRVMYKVALGHDEDDILSGLNLDYVIKATFDEKNKIEEEILEQLNPHLMDALDYHCYMIDIDPNLICNNDNNNQATN